MFRDSEGSRRRMECDGCDVPQACAFVRDCAKWQRDHPDTVTCGRCGRDTTEAVYVAWVPVCPDCIGGGAN